MVPLSVGSENKSNQNSNKFEKRSNEAGIVISFGVGGLSNLNQRGV
jgi:hypothetical protein